MPAPNGNEKSQAISTTPKTVAAQVALAPAQAAAIASAQPAVIAPAQAATAAPAQPAVPLKQAGFVTRLLAFLIDIVIVSLASLIFAGCVSLVLNFFGASYQNLTAANVNRNFGFWIKLAIFGLTGLAVLIFVPGYFIAFWAIIGRTPGKRIMGLRIVRTDGKRLGWVRAVIRYVGYWISFFCLLLGYLWVLVDGRRQAWHDKLADTFVVYVPDDEPNPPAKS